MIKAENSYFVPENLEEIFNTVFHVLFVGVKRIFSFIPLYSFSYEASSSLESNNCHVEKHALHATPLYQHGPPLNKGLFECLMIAIFVLISLGEVLKSTSIL